MKVKELLELLKDVDPELAVDISVDFDSRYPVLRVFTTEYLGLQKDEDCGEITLLFEGYSNQDLSQ